MVLSLAEELSKEHEVAILTPDIGRESTRYQIFPYSNGSVIDVDEFSPDVVLSHTFYLTPQVIEAFKTTVPIVLTLHGDLLNFGSQSDKEMFLNMVPNLNKIVAVCDYGYEQLRVKGKVSEEKLTTIKNGVDINVFSPRKFDRKSLRRALRLPRDKFIFVTPARMTYYKGIEFLLGTLNDMKEYLDQIYFVVATPPSRQREDESEYTKKILRIAQDSRLEEVFSVGFYDFVSMPLLYNACDVLLLPSLTEQLPTSILEAQASGIPVIATNVGGVSEIVSDYKTGLLVDYGDKETLKGKILKIYEDKNLYSKLSRNAKQGITEGYTKEKMVKQYYNILKEIVG